MSELENEQDLANSRNEEKIQDSEIPDGYCRCPKCNGTFYYNNRICYSCFGTGIRVNKKNE